MALIEEAITDGLDTWPKVLEHNSRTIGAKHKAMRYKHYGIWQSYSWQDYLENVRYLALGLLSLGFQPGSKLLIVGDNSPQWYFAELAAQCNRGISVGLHSELSAAEIEYIARDAEVEYAVVEDQEQADKMTQIRGALPALRAVIYWRYKGLSADTDTGTIGLLKVLEMGRAYEREHPEVFKENVAAGTADEICSIIYTSGTMHRPKGALHSHRSLMAGSAIFCAQDHLSGRDDLVSYLSPAWMTERLLVFGCHLLSGGTVDFAESAETHQEDAREIAPSLVVYSSPVWESLAGQVRAKMQTAGLLKRLFTRSLMPVGRRVADLKEQGRKPSLFLALLDLLGDVAVFRHVRDDLGLPHARVCYSSGSTLSPEVMRFFHALKIPLKNVYGSTEAGPVTGITKRVQSFGTVGSVNPGVEIRQTEQGEILVRQPGAFAGYYNDPEATARVLCDGWVHTGDKCLINDGQLVFVDRMESLITTHSGESVSPQATESRLKYSPYIKDAWVLVGKQGEPLSAVIIIDAANTGQWADKQKVAYTTFSELSQDAAVYRLIAREIAQANEGLENSHRIGKFVNLHKEFDPDEAELTRNRKLRRSLLASRYRDLVQALGEDRASIDVEAEFTYQDGRTGRLRTAVRIASVGEGDQ
jgi:long-chain acyl-CoA synthetase